MRVELVSSLRLNYVSNSCDFDESRGNEFENSFALLCATFRAASTEVLLTWQQHLSWTIAASEIIGLAAIQQKCIIKRLRLAGYQQRNFQKEKSIGASGAGVSFKDFTSF